MSGCLMSECSEIVNKIVAKLVEFDNLSLKCRELVRLIIEEDEKIKDYVNHMHRSHVHLWPSAAHTASAIKGTRRGMAHPCLKHFQFVDICLTELWLSKDVNNDGLIYGKDFIISPDDPNKPRVLIDAEEDIQQTFQMYLPCESDKENPEYSLLTWNEFLKTAQEQDRAIPPTVEGKLVQELILGKSRDPLNPDNIYGYTFKIDDDDPDKPKILTNMEKQKDLPDVNEIYTWNEYLKKIGELLTDDEDILEDDLLPKESYDYINSRLIAEWMKNIDIDKNGLIYGHNFYLKDSPHKQQDLKDLELDVDWVPQENAKKLTWEEFCKTFPNNNPDDRGD